MSETTFTASNDIRIERDILGRTRVFSEDLEGKNVLADYDFLDEEEIAALSEFFQHERDNELGWWRWPEDPRYLVRPTDDDEVRVLEESSGISVLLSRGANVGWNRPTFAAARAFFDAHPKPKPLEGAREGEAWLIEWYDEGAFQPVLVLNLGEEFVFRDGSRFKLDHPGVRSARRIFPEVSDA